MKTIEATVLKWEVCYSNNNEEFVDGFEELSEAAERVFEVGFERASMRMLVEVMHAPVWIELKEAKVRELAYKTLNAATWPTTWPPKS